MNRRSPNGSVCSRSRRRRAKSRAARRPPLVLLVDDDADLREMIKLALQHVVRLQVMEAGTSAAALAVARRRKLGLVISDIARPGMNGLKFLKVFKKEHAQVPVIIASGDPGGCIEGEVKNLGAFAFLPKPFLLDSLLKLVSEALALPLAA